MPPVRVFLWTALVTGRPQVRPLIPVVAGVGAERPVCPVATCARVGILP